MIYELFHGWTRRHKYTSTDIQNEILKIISLDILHLKVESLHSTTCYTLIVDETTDSLNYEQLLFACDG